MEKIDAWYLHQMRCKPDKAVVKIFHDDGSFQDSINIPTVLWPLNGPYEVFHFNNCELIEDPVVKEIVDGVHYQIGHCYSNAEKITTELRKKGYNATQYVGWLFISANTHPIHHSWTVLNSNHVIDLADEHAVLDYNSDKFEGADIEKCRELMLDFTLWIRQFPNSKRTEPFGVPAPRLLYIGCPCSRMQGIDIYNALIRMYPDHPCTERVQKNGMTRIQEMFTEAGIY